MSVKGVRIDFVFARLPFEFLPIGVKVECDIAKVSTVKKFSECPVLPRPEPHLADIVTGRNEAVAKVMFLLVSVILLTGGSASVHAGIPPPPLGNRYPPGKQTLLSGKQTPLGSRHPHGKQTPLHPLKQTPPPEKQTPAYGQ